MNYQNKEHTKKRKTPNNMHELWEQQGIPPKVEVQKFEQVEDVSESKVPYICTNKEN